VTEEQAKIEDERVEGFVREDEDEMDVAATVDASTTEVLEGKIVAEEAEALEEEEEEIDELTALHQQLEATQAQADEYLDDLRRERAAFQNYKKRQANERAELRKMAVASLLNQILPVLDDLQRALEAVPEDQSEQPWIAGILLIQRKLHTTLEAVGVVTIDAEPGQPFDPFVHEAVTYEEQEDHQEGEIIAVVQKGYKLDQRVLRPAMVRVAR
jgi:molecular chaperone GrpE